MRWLRDGDLAPTPTAGSGWPARGTDAAPYFRVFNPVTQGAGFDPDGDYVRRYVPELAAPGRARGPRAVGCPAGTPQGYPERIVDHGAERAEALRRYAEVR